MVTEGRYADAAGGRIPGLGRAVVFGAALVASWWFLSSPASADEAAAGAPGPLAAVVDPLAAALSTGPAAAPQVAISTTGDAGPAPTVDEVAATAAPATPATPASPAAPQAPATPASPLSLLDVTPVVATARTTVEQVADPVLEPVKGAVTPVADPVVGAVRPLYEPVATHVLTPLYAPAAVVAPDDVAAFLVDPVAALEDGAAPAAPAGASAAELGAVGEAAALGARAGTVVPGPDALGEADDAVTGLARRSAATLADAPFAAGDQPAAPTAPAAPAPVDPAASRGSLPVAPAGPVTGAAGGGSASGSRDVPDRGHGAVADAVAGVRAMASDRRALAVPRVVGASVNAGSRPAVTPD